jgi:alkyl hydroperoxide reductase subunit AhpC
MPSLNARLADFEGCGAQVLGISVDSVPCHEAWAKALGGLGFPLLSDMHRVACQAYGVHEPERNIARRSTFIVDRQGILRFAETYPPKAIPDPEKLLGVLRAIGGPTGPLRAG